MSVEHHCTARTGNAKLRVVPSLHTSQRKLGMHEHTPLPSPGLSEPWTTPVHPSWAGRTGCGEPALSLVEGAEKHQQRSQNSCRAGASASSCTPELLQDARQNPSSKTFQGIIWILLFWYFSSSEPRTGIQVQTQQFQAPGTRTEPVIGSKMANALKKTPKNPQKSGLGCLFEHAVGDTYD